MFVIGRVDFFVPVALIAEPAPGRSFTDPWNRAGPAPRTHPADIPPRVRSWAEVVIGEPAMAPM